MLDYPLLFRLRQSFRQSPSVADVTAEVDAQLARLSLTQRIQPGQSVAVTVGSRGIARIDRIIKAVVDHLKRIGAVPFLVPAMGSHGGATAEGQRGVLASFGITENTCGCPIRSSMATVVVCRSAEGFPVHFDRHACQADHVLVVNRIKPHTRFPGPLQSGLMKMLLIGLGKHDGALVYHRAIADYSFEQIVRSVAGEVLNKCSIAGGLAIVENARDETALIEAVAPEAFQQRELELLDLARQWMPRLPFDAADVLIVDEIGKEISGTGLDTNVVGRKTPGHVMSKDHRPQIKRIIVRSLSTATKGNAAGIGFAEFCKTRVVTEMDVRSTVINCLTGNDLPAAKIPMHFDTDRELIDAALSTIGLVAPSDARILWIRNTLALTEMECSAAYLAEAQSRDDLEVLTEPRPMLFDDQGNLGRV